MKTSNDEMVTARDLGRTYAKVMKQLTNGELEKAVITRHGRMEAVLITVPRYEELTDGSG